MRGSVDTSLHAVCGLDQPTATALKCTGASEPVLHKKKQTGNEDITITKILKKASDIPRKSKNLKRDAKPRRESDCCITVQSIQPLSPPAVSLLMSALDGLLQKGGLGMKSETEKGEG